MCSLLEWPPKEAGAVPINGVPLDEDNRCLDLDRGGCARGRSERKLFFVNDQNRLLDLSGRR
jgi:hypothetical protein